MKLKRKLAALAAAGMMAVSTLSMSASAATWQSWPAIYTPSTGQFSADLSGVSISNVRWTSADLSNLIAEYPSNGALWHSLEFEFRPNRQTSVGQISKNDVWGSTTTTSSNFPEAYVIYENQSNDPDDVTVGCKKVDVLRSGVNYYARMNMEPGDWTLQALSYTFETELGTMPANGSDSLPRFYATYNNGENNVYFRNIYSW